MIKTLWTLNITPLQRWIRFQIFRLSSLFPFISIHSKQKDALTRYGLTSPL
jgi:hypothetical protein